MKPTRIILMRHGEVYNPNQVLYGRLKNFKLSKTGISQVENSFKELEDKGISAIFASPLLRTRQTARVFSKRLNIPVHYSKLLIEVKLYCEGVSLSEFKEKLQPQLYEKENLLKGQESIQEIETRMMRFMKKIAKEYKGQTVLVVSHGDPIVIVHSFVAKKPFEWEFKRDNYVKTAQYRIIELGENESAWHVIY